MHTNAVGTGHDAVCKLGDLANVHQVRNVYPYCSKIHSTHFIQRRYGCITMLKTTLCASVIAVIGSKHIAKATKNCFVGLTSPSRHHAYATMSSCVVHARKWLGDVKHANCVGSYEYWPRYA